MAIPISSTTLSVAHAQSSGEPFPVDFSKIPAGSLDPAKQPKLKQQLYNIHDTLKRTISSVGTAKVSKAVLYLPDAIKRGTCGAIAQGYTIYGCYYPASRELAVNTDIYLSTAYANHTIAHEMLHAFTSDEFRNSDNHITASQKDGYEEMLTEYFSQKAYTAEPIAYPHLVELVPDIEKVLVAAGSPDPDLSLARAVYQYGLGRVDDLVSPYLTEPFVAHLGQFLDPIDSSKIGQAQTYLNDVIGKINQTKAACPTPGTTTGSGSSGGTSTGAGGGSTSTGSTGTTTFVCPLPAQGEGAALTSGDAQFKVNARAEDKQIVINVQNPPSYEAADGSLKPYTDFFLSRVPGGFSPTGCTTTSSQTGPGVAIIPNTQCIDTAVTDNTSYHYYVTAKPPAGAPAGVGTHSADSIVDFKTTTAAGGKSSSSYRPLFGTTTDLKSFINTLINWVSYKIGPLLVSIMILYAGFQYIGSQGDATKVKEAKDMIWGSVLGFILLMLAGALMKGFFLTS